MSRLDRRAACCLLAAGLGTALLRQPVLADAPPAVRVPQRGFALPNWVDRRDGKPPSRAVLAQLYELGFRTARLPVDPDLVGSPDGATRSAALAAIATALSELHATGFATILDLHPGGDLVKTFASDPNAAARRCLIGWTLLRDVVADQPADLTYAELLNEPPIERAQWLPLRDELAATIRKACPDHTLIWGPSRFQGIWELDGTPPLADRNSIVAVHYYLPLGFTHQCENWDDSPLARLSQLPFPASLDDAAATELADKFRAGGDSAALAYLDNELKTPWTVARIEADFATMGKWAAANGSPMLLGEFGVLDFCVDAKSRALWVATVRRAAEANGAAWTYWEADGGFGFIADRQRPGNVQPEMLAALLGSAPE